MDKFSSYTFEIQKVAIYIVQVLLCSRPGFMANLLKWMNIFSNDASESCCNQAIIIFEDDNDQVNIDSKFGYNHNYTYAEYQISGIFLVLFF